MSLLWQRIGVSVGLWSLIMIALSGCDTSVAAKLGQQSYSESASSISGNTSKVSWEAGVILAGRSGYQCLALEAVGLRPDDEVISIRTSCDCLAPSLIQYATSETAHANGIYLLFLLVFFQAMQPLPAQEDSAESITSMLSSREARIASGLFHWKEKRLVVAGSRVALNGGTFPAAETSFALSSKLVLMEPNLFRHEREGPSWDPVFGEFVDRLYVDSYNGTSAKVFFGALQGASASPPLGFEQSKVQDLENGYLQPLLHYLRPSWLLDQADRVQLLESNVMLNGAVCDVVRVANSKPNAVVEFWLDSSREYLPIRTLSKYGRGDQSQVDYEYVQRNGFWVPSRWTLVFMERGKLVEQIEASVLTGKINEGVTRDSFEFEFPPNTLVTDRSNEVEPEVRIAREGGDRIVSEGEQRASIPYERLVATDGPEETVIPASRPLSLYFVLFPLFGLLIAFSFYLKNRGSKR